VILLFWAFVRAPLTIVHPNIGLQKRESRLWSLPALVSSWYIQCLTNFTMVHSWAQNGERLRKTSEKLKFGKGQAESCSDMGCFGGTVKMMEILVSECLELMACCDSELWSRVEGWVVHPAECSHDGQGIYSVGTTTCLSITLVWGVIIVGSLLVIISQVIRE